MTEKEQSIGALWLKTKGDGGQYFSGVFQLPNADKINIVVFPNGYKTEDKHPDFKIYFQRAKEQTPQAAATNESPAPADDSAPPDIEIRPDDPPFAS